MLCVCVVLDVLSQPVGYHVLELSYSCCVFNSCVDAILLLSMMT